MTTFTRLPVSTVLLVAACVLPAPAAEPPADVVFTGSPTLPIASGVALPEGRAVFWTSGTVPSLIRKDGATAYARYGDTHTQALSCLQRIEEVLATQGLTLRDVVYLRAYVVADEAKDGKPDFGGWFKAYGERFNSATNPAKVARSTVGVASLVHPDWLIEIEAFAVYPQNP